ncbi:MAG: hypothetical protein NTX22_10610 [Ignavibacteriales bacterium]|nr:hypothetical protein [Ignavibacteriales bacterium]
MHKISKHIVVVVLLLFTFSSTGIPVVVHFCHLMGKVSLKSCSMCTVKSNTEKEIKFSGINDCCNNKIAASPLTENYLSSKFSQDQIRISDIITFPLDVNYANNNYTQDKINVLEKSPPIIPGNSLFILNLQLVI